MEIRLAAVGSASQTNSAAVHFGASTHFPDLLLLFHHRQHLALEFFQLWNCHYFAQSNSLRGDLAGQIEVLLLLAGLDSRSLFDRVQCLNQRRVDLVLLDNPRVLGAAYGPQLPANKASPHRRSVIASRNSGSGLPQTVPTFL